jgi:hypothetical protein
MNENTFAVTFSGQLVDGANADQVKANFAQLFKVDIAKVAPMFSGKPVTIKKGLDEATAKKYQQALLKAGAVCQVVALRPAATATPSPAVTPQAAAAAATPAAGLKATLAEPGVLLKEPEQVPPLQVETSHLSLGAVGETIIEPEPVPEFQAGLDGLSMAEVGVQLVPPTSVEAPQIDVSALTLAEAGVVLKEPEPVEAAQIDTSKISLA